MRFKISILFFIGILTMSNQCEKYDPDCSDFRGTEIRFELRDNNNLCPTSSFNFCNVPTPSNPNGPADWVVFAFGGSAFDWQKRGQIETQVIDCPTNTGKMPWNHHSVSYTAPTCYVDARTNVLKSTKVNAKIVSE